MTMLKTKEEERLMPRPPASAYNIVSTPTPPSRRTDNGDAKERQPLHSSSISAKERQPLHSSSMSPLAAEIAATTKSSERTPTVVLTQVAPRSKKNRPKAVEGSQKQLNRDGWPTMTRPGAIAVGTIATRSGRSSPPQTSRTGQSIEDSVSVDGGTPLEPQIVAVLAPNVDDQIEVKIAQKVEERFRRQVERVVVADEVNDDDSSTYCGLKIRTLLLVGVLSLLLIIGAVVGGVLSSPATEVPGLLPTPAPTRLDDPLLEQLRSLKATPDDDLDLFSDPMSAQSQALAWMKNDTIVMSPGRSTQDVLQRYVLAVLFYATSGRTWHHSSFYLSKNDVCSWNKGEDVYGVYCRLDAKSVDVLILSENYLQGQLPWELVLLTNLEVINLSRNALIGSMPTKLGQLLSLTSLELSNNYLTETIPTELGQLTSLTNLAIYYNQFTGTIPTELGQLLSLPSLDIRSNQLTGTIPTELGQLTSLAYLNIGRNHLTGTIPYQLGRLLSLTYLDIGTNQLTGTILTELGQLVSLNALSVIENNLNGTIPTELGQLLSLQSLNIWHNRLTGTIPTELGQLLALTYLSIEDNQLTGTIPTELGQLLSLQSFYISINQLTGTIPTELGGMGNMTNATFFNNAFTGTLDQSLFCGENRTWRELQVDCDVLVCSCCQCKR